MSGELGSRAFDKPDERLGENPSALTGSYRSDTENTPGLVDHDYLMNVVDADAPPEEDYTPPTLGPVEAEFDAPPEDDYKVPSPSHDYLMDVIDADAPPEDVPNRAEQSAQTVQAAGAVVLHATVE